jgi:hypothetical protein
MRLASLGGNMATKTKINFDTWDSAQALSNFAATQGLEVAFAAHESGDWS